MDPVDKIVSMTQSLCRALGGQGDEQPADVLAMMLASDIQQNRSAVLSVLREDDPRGTKASYVKTALTLIHRFQRGEDMRTGEPLVPQETQETPEISETQETPQSHPVEEIAEV